MYTTTKPAMSKLDPRGRRCVSFTISGDWAHFRRVDTTNDKQTYRVIPRTTVAGLLAAVLGEPRDSYYDVFAAQTSAIAIVPNSPLRTMQMPMLTVPTEEGNIQTAEGVSGKTVIPPKVLERERKRRSFEYLCNPTYRIHTVLDDEEWMDRLVDRLDAKGANPPSVRSVYTPALGKSECIAEITESSVGTVRGPETVSVVDSTVPEANIMPTAEVSYTMERTPGYMSRADGGRRTDGFVSYAYPTDGGTVEIEEIEAYNINGDTVCFF